MDKVFLVYDDKVYTYKMLLDDMNKKTSCPSTLYVKDNNPYEIFLNLLHSLIHGYSIEIVDGGYSVEELQALEVSLDDQEIELSSMADYKCFEDIVARIRCNNKWLLKMHTSGTTGRPKKVSHSFESLTRHVLIHEKMNNDVWAYAYNPTHMAGLQVFFQAFLNQNTMVYVFNKNPNQILDCFKHHNITCISATPTFYRSVFSLKSPLLPKVKRVTFGGEKYDASFNHVIQHVFPNAKIRNIYASTEAGSLFVAEGDYFKIPSKYRACILINENNELLIHESLLGESKSFEIVDGWYKTGDLVERLDDVMFKFISRTTDMINVGGNKVNPHEVESVISKVPGVVDVLIKSKSNRVTGEIIIADVVIEKDCIATDIKKDIKQYANQHLQKWKVPRMIVIVDEISRGKTGKKVRK